MIESEGDLTTWHIRLVKRIAIPGGEDAEAWALFNGDQQESSAFPKDSVRRWRDEELGKL